MTSAVPHPRTEAEPARGSARGGRRSLAFALLSGAAGAVVALLATRQGWADGTVAVAGGDFSLSAKGSDVTGVPPALAIVGLAALVAVFAVRGAGRTVVSGLLALCGAGTVAAAVMGANDGSVLDDQAARASGNTAAAVQALSHTAWPYAAAAGGVLILLAGLLALRYGRGWPGMSARYERDGSPRKRRPRRVDPDRPEDLWKALDRGEDPTTGGA